MQEELEQVVFPGSCDGCVPIRRARAKRIRTTRMAYLARKKVYDAIVMGSGIIGGCAAKEPPPPATDER